MDFAYQGKNPPTKLGAMVQASNANLTNISDPWLADFGISNHLTANLSNLSIQSQYKGPEQITLGNGQTLSINHIGNASLSTKYHNFVLKNVLHVLRIAMNLLFVHKFCLDNNYSCHFDAHELKIQDVPIGRILYRGLSENGLYPIYSKNFIKHHQPVMHHPHSTTTHSQSHMPISTSFHVQKSNKWFLWYHGLGHPSDNILRTALSSYNNSMNCTNSMSNSVSHCKHCLSGKMHKLPFNKFVFLASKPLELVHSDVWGPAPITSINDFRYYFVFIVEFSKFTWVYLLKNKFDVFDVFKYFKAYIETQLNTQIKILRTYGSGENTSNAFNNFCSSSDIIHQTSCPHTSQ